MSRKAKLAAVSAASVAAVALTASPAAAWTNGTFTATSGNLTVKVNNTPVATCTSTVLKGRINTAGVFSVTSATASGCPVPVSTTGFPWPGSFGTTTATVNNAKVSALGCTYTGNLTGPASAPPRPPATVTITNAPVSGSGLFCFSGVTISATFVFTQP